MVTMLIAETSTLSEHMATFTYTKFYSFCCAEKKHQTNKQEVVSG